MPEKEWHELTGRAKYRAYLQSGTWRSKCILIRKRDNNRCVHCHYSNEDSVIIQVHHKTYERLYREKPQDLETVCHRCHAKIHGKPVRGQPNTVGVILITRLLGLRSVTFDDLKAIGIDLDKVQKVEYGKGTEGGSSDADKIHQKELAEICMALANGDKVKAADILEGLSEFKGDNDKMISRRTAKALKGKWLNATLGKARKEHKELFGHDYGHEPENENQDEGKQQTLGRLA